MGRFASFASTDASSPRHIRRSTGSFQLSMMVLSVLLLAAAPRAFPQATSGSDNIAAPLKRDSASVQLLEKSIRAMQGQSRINLRALHSVGVTGSYMIAGSTDATAFTWTDDWASGARIKRVTHDGDGNGRHKGFIQTPDGVNSPAPNLDDVKAGAPGYGNRKVPVPNGSEKKITMKRQRFDSVSSLILHMPAAAFYLALQSNDYSIMSMPQPRDLRTPVDCVHIQSFRDAKRETDPVNLLVCVAKDTAMPVKSYISLNDMLHPGRHYIEFLHYKDFQADSSGAMVPHTVSITGDGMKEKTITIESVSWNPDFNKNEQGGRQ